MMVVFRNYLRKKLLKKLLREKEMEMEMEMEKGETVATLAANTAVVLLVAVQEKVDHVVYFPMLCLELITSRQLPESFQQS